MKLGLGVEGVGRRLEAQRGGAEKEQGGGRQWGTWETLTFALFVRSLGASRRHLFAGCGASRLITLPAA